MNAHGRRLYRRAYHRLTGGWFGGGCHKQGYSGTTSYPDLMCTNGFMTDMDSDGFNPSTSRPPCPDCQPAAYAAWQAEEHENDED